MFLISSEENNYDDDPREGYAREREDGTDQGYDGEGEGGNNQGYAHGRGDGDDQDYEDGDDQDYPREFEDGNYDGEGEDGNNQGYARGRRDSDDQDYNEGEDGDDQGYPREFEDSARGREGGDDSEEGVYDYTAGRNDWTSLLWSSSLNPSNVLVFYMLSNGLEMIIQALALPWHLFRQTNSDPAPNFYESRTKPPNTMRWDSLKAQVRCNPQV